MRRSLIALPLLAMLAAAPQQARAEGWLDRFNRAMFAANTALAEGAEAVVAALPAGNPVPQAWREAGANLLLNTINEPLTAISQVIAGRGEAAVTSLRRFGINLVQGYGGLVDRATEIGITEPYLDIGLALCLRGVPEGPYVVLPVVGPRTLRDAVADLIATNAIIYAALVPLVGTTPSGPVLLLVLLLDEVMTFVLARQIDAAPEEASGSFEGQRDAYLERRAQRCAEASTTAR